MSQPKKLVAATSLKQIEILTWQKKTINIGFSSKAA